MILKELLSSEIDFEYWSSGYSSDFLISSNEDKPKYYPCIVVYKYVESEYIKDYVYYEFVYLDDFEKTEDTTKETDNNYNHD